MFSQVTAGGVPLSEVDEAMQSRLCPGLYLAGELCNIDGDCGGFNLHWAWSSGMIAGYAAAQSLL
jgi:predicted flavoprotein YhiN